MLVDRFTFPCSNSKYQTFINQGKYGQPDKVKIHQFYRALDILAKHKEKLESALFNQTKKNLGLQKLIFIAGQGMLSNNNLKHIRSYGYEYIIGDRIRSKPAKVKEDILDLSTYANIETKKEKDILKTRSLSGIDEEGIFRIKNILDKQALTMFHLRQIGSICKSMVNTILASDIRRHLKEYINDLIMIKMICKSGKKYSAIQLRS